MTKICTEKEIDTICKDLKQEKVVGFPTETVYGLAILADSKKAFDELVQLKKRPINKPMTVMVAKKEKIHDYALVNQKQQKIIDTFMPGPLTIILKAKEHLPHTMTLGQKSIGFRIPNHELSLEILKCINKPLLVTSANISSSPAFIQAKDVYHAFKDQLSSLIDADSLGKNASTVIDLTQDRPLLLRKGEISFEDILKVWESE